MGRGRGWGGRAEGSGAGAGAGGYSLSHDSRLSPSASAMLPGRPEAPPRPRESRAERRGGAGVRTAPPRSRPLPAPSPAEDGGPQRGGAGPAVAGLAAPVSGALGGPATETSAASAGAFPGPGSLFPGLARVSVGGRWALSGGWCAGAGGAWQGRTPLPLRAVLFVWENISRRKDV